MQDQNRREWSSRQKKTRRLPRLRFNLHYKLKKKSFLMVCTSWSVSQLAKASNLSELQSDVCMLVFHGWCPFTWWWTVLFFKRKLGERERGKRERTERSRARESVCVCVCVCEWERNRQRVEREGNWQRGIRRKMKIEGEREREG